MTSPYVGPTGCKWTILGTEYVGTVSVTQNGTICQAWTAQSPHVPESLTDSDFPDGSIAAAENYCRNPNNTAGGPWCYTMDPNVTWQYCNIAFCRKSAFTAGAPEVGWLVWRLPHQFEMWCGRGMVSPHQFFWATFRN